MEPAHRNKIVQNIEKLIQHTDYDQLMRQCIEHKLLFDVMQEQIEASTTDKKLRHRLLLDKVTHRGPKAFELFSSILKNHFPDAFDFFNHLDSVYGEGEVSLSRRRGNCRANIFTNGNGNGNGNGNSNGNSNGNGNGNSNGNINNTNATLDRHESPPIVVSHVRQLSLPNPTTTNETTDSARIAIGAKRNGTNGHGLINNGFHMNGGATRAHQSTSNGVNGNGTMSTDSLTLKEFTLPMKSRLNVTVHKSTKFHGQESGNKVTTYRMMSLNRGVLFLVNIIHFDESRKKRNGADADRDNLIALFQGMGFKIFYYENLKRDEFIKLVDQLVVSKHLRHTDCLVFALLTHGDRDYASFNVEFSDLLKMDVEEILGKFSNSNCDRLVGRPKIFIFPFCRGVMTDPGIPGRRKIESDHISAIQMRDSFEVPTYTDMKICYATVPGFRSFRDPESGSWYIQVMCTVWSEHAHDTHLDDLLKMVGNTAGEKRTEESKMQTCSNEDRGFFKKLYFNPGFYGNNGA